MQIDLKNSYPFQSEKINEHEKSVFDAFPKDYQNFLKANNGGMIDEPSKYSFKTPLVRKFEDGRVYEDSSNGIEEFWGFLSYQNEKPGEVSKYPQSILHEFFDRHHEEQFLPQGVLVIGRCVQNSLIAISLNEHDYGSVYYWEWYWRYPWFEDYFQKRLDEAADQFEDVNAILDDTKHPQYQEALDALNYGILVKVAPSFGDFIAGLYEEVEELKH